MDLSPLVPVAQRFPRRALSDVAEAVRATMRLQGIGSELPAGARVAVGVGSRGISNHAAIVRAVVAHFLDLGLCPFVIPAMGSHGAATAEGQRKVLEHSGITEAAMGCPIHSQLEVKFLGRSPEGIPCFMDRLAFESDGVFLVNRVKWHTTFDAPLESGLVKMAAIGLGKLHGATEYHREAVRFGFGEAIAAGGKHVLASGKILGGLAILEDAHHETEHVEAIRAECIAEVEARLLERVKRTMPRIGFDEVDILIVDEIGKEISGVGMDSKVINRHPYGAVNPWTFAPRITRVYVRGISAKSYGNANGFGMADMISERLFQGIDWPATKMNAMTANNFAGVRTPLRASCDREALETLAGSVGRERSADVTVVRIKNTLELSRMLVTENLVGSGGVEVVGAAVGWSFDERGDLMEWPQMNADERG